MSELTHEPSSNPNEPPPAAPNSTAAEVALLAALADHFAERVRRQERPEVEEYAAKHPELADEIRKLFPTIALIEESRTVDAASPGGSQIAVILVHLAYNLSAPSQERGMRPHDRSPN